MALTNDIVSMIEGTKLVGPFKYQHNCQMVSAMLPPPLQARSNKVLFVLSGLSSSPFFFLVPRV